MKLDKLWMHDFRNLKDVTIDFDENSLSTVLIGPNASAKSNLLEAIVLIFKNLDLFENPEFRYKLQYLLEDRIIEIDADPDRTGAKTQIFVDGKKILIKEFKKNSRKYLPRNVFGYYSGTSTRFRECFKKHQDIFYQKIIYDQEPPLRPLFFAETYHGQYVLLAFFSFKEKSSLEFLEEMLGITGIDEITFVLKQPYWYSPENREDIFWGARGVVRRFLDDLVKISDVTEKEKNWVYLPNKRSTREKQFSLTIKDLDAFQKLALKYNDSIEFFKMLESTAISDLIHELKIKVIKKGVKDNVEFPQLSEGEQQLLVVLGLLKFMKQEESLFLLDEPDTHLNPSWKFEYLDLLKRVVGPYENSHVIIVTHDPLVIGGLKKEQVQIFSLKGDDKTVEIHPAEIDPIGLGVEGLLIDIFGLDTTLDLPTQRKLKRRKDLVVKKEIMNEGLSSEEKAELKRLNSELMNLGILSRVRDPIYSNFLKQLQKYQLRYKIEFSELEREEQVELTKKIIEEIRSEKKSDI